MSQHQTTTWKNIKGRVQYLKEHGDLFGEGAEWAFAIVEEIDRLRAEIENLKKLMEVGG